MKKIAAVLLITSGLTTMSANADVGYGIGASIVFGAKSGVDFGFGPKIFSTNKEKKVAASVGVDYLFISKAFRPNIGVSYLFKDNVYTDINAGYNLKDKAIDLGFGVGYTETKSKDSSTTVTNNNDDSTDVDPGDGDTNDGGELGPGGLY